MASLTLNLLGQPSLRCPEAGANRPDVGAKALALLAYLALEPGPHSREELAGLLWGESSEAAARASLRQVVMQLRNQLGDLIEGDRSTVRLSATISSDVLDFRRLLTENPAQAVTADIPRFLAGFSLRGAPQFEEWIAETRRELLREYQNALGTLARAAMGQWRWREAADYAERWLSCDPLSDEAVRLAIEARYLAGDRGGALGRFAQYRAALAAEIGCQPGRALLSLIQRVEADATAAANRPITDEWYARGPAFESSLVGREREWSALTKAWKAVRRGSGQLVILEGEPGVGKSRLAEEFTRWLVADGGTALRGRGYDGRTGVPYEPIVELLRDACNAPGLAGTDPEWLAEVVRLLPELRRRFPALEPAVSADDAAAEGWRLFEGVAQLLLALAAERPVAIWLDDLHWYDQASCQLVRFLIRRTERSPVLWLATVTLGELDRESPAAQLSRLLRAKAQAQVLTLDPLSEDDIWQVIHQMGHLSAPAGGKRFAKRLFGVTRGNPFYLVELLKTMFAQGVLAEDESGEWTPTPGTLTHRREVPISRDVHEVIAERIERLPEPLRNVLVTVAVNGTGCSTEVLAHIHGIPRFHAAALADALVERRLLTEEGGAYRCHHPVVGRVVRERLTAARRREVHRALALALETFGAADEPGAAGEIARHADHGNERALAYRFGLLAAAAAKERSAYGEAVGWLQLAAKNQSDPAQDEEVKRLTALVLEAAGSSGPLATPILGGPITRGLEEEDFDLPVKQRQ